MNDNKVENLMEHHPSLVTFDFHPIRFVKKLSEEEWNDKDQIGMDSPHQSALESHLQGCNTHSSPLSFCRENSRSRA